MRPASVVLLAIVILVVGIFLIIVYVPVSDLPPRPGIKIAGPKDSNHELASRFKIASSYTIGESDDLTVRKIQIWKDTETGVEYLVFWSGGPYGGPAICRLWGRER